MKKFFYSRLAAQNLKKNGQFYLPYILTVAGVTAAFYILCALANTGDLPQMSRYAYLKAFLGIGLFVVALFSVIFLIYTNHFLMKRRSKEIGLYNILGMDKRNIAVMMGLESLYTAFLGIGGGLLCGILLQRLITMLLYRLIDYNTSFQFYISGFGILASLVLYGTILFVTFLLNLRRIHVQKPIALLQGNQVGEKEPKTRWVLTVLGVLTLGAGYGIALIARNALEALALYFVAVFLVIIGTYCLFTVVSIAVCKALRKNKAFYYKTGNFISVSGMLYRMKRNGVGLANICILSTMVLVMISGTLALYIGTEDAMASRYPAAYTAQVRYDPSDNFNGEVMLERVCQGVEDQGLQVTSARERSYLSFAAIRQGNDYTTAPDEGLSSMKSMHVLCILTAEDYGKITGDTPELSSDEVLLCTSDKVSNYFKIDFLSLETGDSQKTLSWHVSGVDKEFAGVSEFSSYVTKVQYVVVADKQVQTEIWRCQKEAYGDESSSLTWIGEVDSDGTEEQQIACAQAISDPDVIGIAGPEGVAAVGDWERYAVFSHAENENEMYALNAGFLFLGIFLGILFIMAAVLIMYYKQISEGYEDRERFQIMKKVGLPEDEVKKSIGRQILLVFFAPLVVAAIHVAFDFRLIIMLLSLFQLNNVMLTFWCTAGTLLAFAVLYALVYAATAKAYYRIVK